MDKDDFKPGIRTETMHQMGTTFGGVFGLNLGYAMDLFIDSIDLTMVTPLVAMRDNLEEQVQKLRNDRTN